MRMRTDIEAPIDPGCNIERPHMVEEYEWPDHPPPGEGKDAPDGKTAA